MKPSPSNMGRCDICGKTVDLEHAGDEMLLATEEEFGNADHDVSAQEAIDGVIRSLDWSDNVHDDMLADALREDNAYRVHRRCWDKTTLADAVEPVESDAETVSDLDLGERDE